MLIQILFYLAFLLFSLGQIGRVSFYNQQVNIYLYEIFLAILTLTLFFKYKFKPIKYYYDKFKYFFWFFGFIFISYLIGFNRYSFFENLIGLLYQVRLFAYFLYFIYFGYYLKKNKNKKIIQIGFLLFAISNIFSSLLQYFFYPDLRNLQYLGWDPHYFRLFGVFFDSSVAAAVYGLCFLYFYFRNKNYPVKNFGYLLITIFFIFIGLTFSRISYIALVLTLFVIFFRNKEYKKILIIVILFVSLLLILPKPFGESVNLLRTFTIESRINDIKNGFKIWEKNPLIGIGYDRIRYAKKHLKLLPENQEINNHAGAAFSSSFVTILVSTGIIGLILFILSLFQLARVEKNGVYFIIFLSIMSLTDNIFLHPFILFLVFSLLSDKLS